jgi:hypothetical protein
MARSRVMEQLPLFTDNDAGAEPESASELIERRRAAEIAAVIAEERARRGHRSRRWRAADEREAGT